MALFGKKKRAEQSAAPTTDETTVIEPTDDDAELTGDGAAFDFDAIARDLDASDGPSPFDSLLANPAASHNPASADHQEPIQSRIARDEATGEINGAASDSAFDFPMDTGDDDSETEPATAQGEGFDPFATDDFSSQNAAPAPQSDADFPAFDAHEADFGAPFAAPAEGYNETLSGAPAGIAIAPVGQAEYAAPIGEAEYAAAPVVSQGGALLNTAPILTTDLKSGNGGVASKKGLPLVPLLGVGALLLALAGAGWWAFGRPQPEPNAPVIPPVVARKPPAQVAPPAPKPVSGVVPATNAAAPGVPPSAQEIAQTKPKPLRAVLPAKPAVAPAKSAVVPAKSAVPATPARLKTLWRQGADAKHRGDIAGARRAWQEMLVLSPRHRGIQSAIDKLAQKKG